MHCRGNARSSAHCSTRPEQARTITRLIPVQSAPSVISRTSFNCPFRKADKRLVSVSRRATAQIRCLHKESRGRHERISSCCLAAFASAVRPHCVPTDGQRHVAPSHVARATGRVQRLAPPRSPLVSRHARIRRSSRRARDAHGRFFVRFAETFRWLAAPRAGHHPTRSLKSSSAARRRTRVNVNAAAACTRAILRIVFVHPTRSRPTSAIPPPKPKCAARAGCASGFWGVATHRPVLLADVFLPERLAQIGLDMITVDAETGVRCVLRAAKPGWRYSACRQRHGGDSGGVRLEAHGRSDAYLNLRECPGAMHKRIDTSKPSYEYDRALAFELAAQPRLACAKAPQRNADGVAVTIEFLQSPPGACERRRLSLWTPDGFGWSASLDPLLGSTRSWDDTWIALPEPKAIRWCATFIEAAAAPGRSVWRRGLQCAPHDCGQEFARCQGQRCTARLVVDGSPALAPSGRREPNRAARFEHRHRRDPQPERCMDLCPRPARRQRCHDLRQPRRLRPCFGGANMRPSARAAMVALRNASAAAAADAEKTLALNGRNDEGVDLQSNFSSCPASAVMQACH